MSLEEADGTGAWNQPVMYGKQEGISPGTDS